MTKADMRDLAAEWLAPMDEVLGDLIDKSETMTPGAFAQEVQAVIDRIPQMFSMLNQQALATALEDAIGEAMIQGIEGNV